jgi:hypothetical protein
MKVFAYSFQDLLGSYFRVLFGLVLTSVPLLLLNPSSVIVYLLAFLAVLFFCYGARTIIRQLTRLEVSQKGINMIGPFNRAIKWEELGGFKLSYYSTRRDREAGWMHLKLKGKGLRLGIDSTISEFDELVKLAYSAASLNGIVFDASTIRNLRALRISGSPEYPSYVKGTIR